MTFLKAPCMEFSISLVPKVHLGILEHIPEIVMSTVSMRLQHLNQYYNVSPEKQESEVRCKSWAAIPGLSVWDVRLLHC